MLCVLTLLTGQFAICQDNQTLTLPNYAIAYSSNESTDESATRNIYLSDPEGKSRIKLTDFPGGNGYSAWSPDGKRLAFYAKYDDRKTWSIHTMNADGSNRQRLTHLQYAWDSSPTWSPDGRQIAFARAYKDSLGVRQFEIWIMNADGSGQQQIKGLAGGGPYFAPDGPLV